MSKRNFPHVAVINFDIDIRAIDLRGDPASAISDERLATYNMGRKAQITVSGVSEADCVQNIKNKLEKLNEPLGE